MGSHVSSPPDTRDVLDAIRRIVHALRESSRQAEQHTGLSGAQLFVLQKLAEAAPASVNDLAARTHTHQSSVSTVVARLVAARLVTRTRSATDRRSVQLALTPAGRRLIERAPDVAQERLVRAIDSLPSRRRQALASTLGALADALALVGKAPAMFFEDASRRKRQGTGRG